MKTATQTLKDLLYNNEQHFVADLLTFVFADGTRRWSAYSSAITTGGNTWSLGPGIDLGDSRTTAGVETDTLDVRLYPVASVTIGGASMLTAARTGLFDNVRVYRDLAFMTSPTTVVELIREFDGYVSLAEPSTTEIRLTVRSLLERLDKKIPPRLTSAQCPFRVYDAATCGVTLISSSTTVASGSTASVVNVASATNAVVGSSVTIGGASRSVRSVAGTALTLNSALPSTPTVGAGVTIVRGCDRQRPTCIAAPFSNILRFGGFPDQPKSEVS